MLAMILGAAAGMILLPSSSTFVLALDHHTGAPGWARGGGPGGAWNLPPVGRSSTHKKKKRYNRHDWLEQCEQSLAVVVASFLRGGGGDDWNTYGGQQGDYYGEDDERHPQPEADDYYSRAPPAYDDYEDYSPAPKTSRSSSSSSDIARILKYGDRKIGLLLLGAGLTVTMLGFTLFFNKALLKLGNVLLLAGVPVTLGPTRTLGYLAQREKWRASACLGFGMFLVLVSGHPFLGILAEVFGLLNIFGNLFPVLMVFAKQVPILGTVLKASNNNGSGGRKKKSSSRQQYQEEDDYYYDDYREDDYRGDPYGSGGGGDDDDRGGPYY